MGILAGIKESRSSLAEPDERLLRLFGVTESASGVVVTERTALTLAAWWACIQVISEDTATMPLLTYRRLKPKGKERAHDHPIYDILHIEPNPEMTSFNFRQTLTGHIPSWGNAYAEIVFDRSGYVKELWPLRPDHMHPERKNGAIRYVYYLNGKNLVLPPERILHLVGLSFDGLKGYSPTRMAMESIGLALGAEKFGATLFANNARPGGYLKHPSTLSKEAQDRLLEQFEDRTMGLTKAHRLQVLEEGMEFQEVGMPPEDVQFLTTRQYQAEEICRWHRMQPHKIQHLLRSTYSNIEHQSIEHWSDTIQPYCTRWEQEITRKCFTRMERSQFFVEHLAEAILKSDTKSRYEAYAIGKQWGFLSTNDIHERENMNPVEGGDVYLQPLNMVPAGTVLPIKVGGEEKPARSESRALETRGAGEGRRRLSEAYRPLFERVMKSLIGRERNDILRGARKAFDERGETDFIRWAREYYRELHENGFHYNELWGLYASLAEVIEAEAAMEISAPAKGVQSVEGFLREYVQAYVQRHSDMSLADILGAIGDPEGDPLALLEAKLDSWDARPEQDARWEAHRAANAVAREAWRGNGVTKLRWQTFGDNCPYCNHLSGKIVGIDDAFAVRGDHLQDPDNPDHWMSFSTDFHHPPLHAGCDCAICAA